MTQTSTFVPDLSFLHRPIVSQKLLQHFKILSSFGPIVIELGPRFMTHISRHLSETLLVLQHFCSGESGSKNQDINLNIID